MYNKGGFRLGGYVLVVKFSGGGGGGGGGRGQGVCPGDFVLHSVNKPRGEFNNASALCTGVRLYT